MSSGSPSPSVARGVSDATSSSAVGLRDEAVERRRQRTAALGSIDPEVSGELVDLVFDRIERGDLDVGIDEVRRAGTGAEAVPRVGSKAVERRGHRTIVEPLLLRLGRMLLTEADRAMLDGADGPAVALSMRVILRLARVTGADELLDISGAHIDSCLFHGTAGLDFARTLAEGGGRVRVPTTLNVSSLDLLHPELYRGDQDTAADARRLMDHYEEMGCIPTWTCAPYQRSVRPGLGEHVAWAESNAIVFANSVLGARTARYGDFVDICAAITGRAPAGSFHLDEHRHARIVFDVTAIGDRVAEGAGPALLGHVIGRRSGTKVPVIVGCPSLDEDQLKTLGSAAASSGSVAMFHVVGSTPEASTIEAATGGAAIDALPHVAALPHVILTPADLRSAWDELSTVTTDASTDTVIGAVSLGTPHYSITEFAVLVELVKGARRRAIGSVSRSTCRPGEKSSPSSISGDGLRYSRRQASSW